MRHAERHAEEGIELARARQLELWAGLPLITDEQTRQRFAGSGKGAT